MADTAGVQPAFGVARFRSLLVRDHGTKARRALRAQPCPLSPWLDPSVAANASKQQQKKGDKDNDNSYNNHHRAGVGYPGAGRLPGQLQVPPGPRQSKAAVEANKKKSLGSALRFVVCVLEPPNTSCCLSLDKQLELVQRTKYSDSTRRQALAIVAVQEVLSFN